jgi:hypothetical protein
MTQGEVSRRQTATTPQNKFITCTSLARIVHYYSGTKCCGFAPAFIDFG